jgi:hypothetical protein
MALLALAVLAAAGCGGSKRAGAAAKAPSYAVYAEFASGSNKVMKGGLNRRVFNKIEAQAGSDIKLNSDGSISLLPGTYRMTGFSLVSMQTTFAPPTIKHDNNYPGYCLVYPKAYESSKDVLKHTIVIGSPGTAFDGTPSLFNVVYTTHKKIDIAVGHQSGDNLHGEVYLSVYKVNGVPSNYHVFARIAITKL